MRNRYGQFRGKLFVAPTGASTEVESPAHVERHYAVTDIAEVWNLSADKVRELFENEPGVLVIGERTPPVQTAVCYAANSPVRARSRPSSVVVEAGHPVGEHHSVNHLSPSPKELQTENGRPRLPALSLPYLGRWLSERNGDAEVAQGQIGRAHV